MDQIVKQVLMFFGSIIGFVIVMILIMINAMENKKLFELQQECQKAGQLWNSHYETCMIGEIPYNFPYGGNPQR